MNHARLFKGVLVPVAIGISTGCSAEMGAVPEETEILPEETEMLGVVEQALNRPIAPEWCTHSTAQRFDVDVDGNGSIDAICHDRVTGFKWVALRQSGALREVWVNTDVRFCSHVGARLFAADVNGDGRADLICKDPGRIWVDYGSSKFYSGTNWWLDTPFCTHSGAEFFVGDQNGDGRADLVCRDGGPHPARRTWVDFADSAGRFAPQDTVRHSPDFIVRHMFRSPSGLSIVIQNLGTDGVVTGIACSDEFTGVARFVNLSIPAGGSRTTTITAAPRGRSVECAVTSGRGSDGQAELFVSNNSLRLSL